MTKKIRMLSDDDIQYLEAMDTGIEDDYVYRIFQRLTSDSHRLYGLFIDDKMVSMAGYTIFAKRYAMLGRLRSDRRFRGRNLSTELIAHIKDEAFQENEINWVGANTQKENLPARRIVEKLGFTPYPPLHSAINNDVSQFELSEQPWTRVNCLERKKDLLEQTYVKTKALFPYECYYSFPASADLFQEDKLKQWNFYENEARNRFLITKYDQKKHHYLHVVYPWNDLMTQQGLWETVANDFNELKKKYGDDTYIWTDFTREVVQTLPENHTFQLDSPWMLYGIEREK